MENLWRNNLKNITLRLVKSVKIYKVQIFNSYSGFSVIDLSLNMVGISSLWEYLTTVVRVSGISVNLELDTQSNSQTLW